MNTKLIIPIVVVVALLIHSSASAETPLTDSRRFNPSLLAEIGGMSSGVLALHLEVPVWQTMSVDQQVRISFGVTSAVPGPACLPFCIKYLTGDSDHFAELGLGVSYVHRYRDVEPFITWSQSKFLPGAVIAYRYLPSDGGFNFRVGYMPHYDPGAARLNSMIGIAIGWSL